MLIERGSKKLSITTMRLAYPDACGSPSAGAAARVPPSNAASAAANWSTLLLRICLLLDADGPLHAQGLVDRAYIAVGSPLAERPRKAATALKVGAALARTLGNAAELDVVGVPALPAPDDLAIPSHRDALRAEDVVPDGHALGLRRRGPGTARGGRRPQNERKHHHHRHQQTWLDEPSHCPPILKWADRVW